VEEVAGIFVFVAVAPPVEDWVVVLVVVEVVVVVVAGFVVLVVAGFVLLAVDVGTTVV
jgi:hypothetical protein